MNKERPGNFSLIDLTAIHDEQREAHTAHKILTNFTATCKRIEYGGN